MKKQHSNHFQTLFTEIIVWIPVFVLVFGALAAVSFQIEALAFRYPLDYGEAPLVNQAMQLNAGNPIYQQSLQQPPYTIANYPPVYVGLMAVFEKIFGPAFWYGRLISSLSAIGSAAMIFLILASRSNNWKIALIASLLFFNMPYVVGWSTLARIDHLALFFALTGLFLIFRIKSHLRLINSDMILGSVFLVLAIFTRQSYALAAPFAGFLYLLHKDWRRAAVLTGLVGGISLVFFLLINFLTEGGFYFNIVTANINPFGMERLFNNFRNFFEISPFLCIFAVLGIVLLIKAIDGWPMLIGFAVGGFLSAVTIGKIGSNVNYFLEFAAGLSLLVGFGLVILRRLPLRMGTTTLLCTALFLMAWQGARFINVVDEETRGTLDSRQEVIEELADLEALVAENSDQPILADEYMGMITLNDESLYLQPFEITQLVIGGLFDQHILIEEIEKEKFSLILLQEDSWWVHALQERWTPEMLEAIRANYRLAGQFENTFAYKPKTSKIHETPSSCPNGLWPLPTDATMGYRYEDGNLTLYGIGPEGTVPVEAVASGEVHRPEPFPEGALVVVHEDPFNPGGKVIVYYSEMRSFRNGQALIPERFPSGSAGLDVDMGETIGYQSMWAGRTFMQDWLHVTLGIAPYDPQFLVDFQLLEQNLVHPGAYFGIMIEPDVGHIKPLICMD